MAEREASSTAVAVAALRAAHRLFDAPPWILDDPIAERLLDSTSRERLRGNPDQLAHPRIRALRSQVLLRSRYAEDRAAAAVQRGVRQLVMLGAGYDTFAYRQPSWAEALNVVEVDHPASQAAKRDSLRAAGIAVPANVTFIPVDFETETIGAGLRRGGFDPTRPTFLSWLGVMVYLRRDAVEAVFRFVASLPSGSEITFTFSPPAEGVPDGTASAAAAMGEPWLTRLTRHDLEAILRELGFSEVTFLSPHDAAVRYFGERSDGLPAPLGVRIGSAVV